MQDASGVRLLSVLLVLEIRQSLLGQTSLRGVVENVVDPVAKIVPGLACRVVVVRVLVRVIHLRRMYQRCANQNEFRRPVAGDLIQAAAAFGTEPQPAA